MIQVSTPLVWNPVSIPGLRLTIGHQAARTAATAVRALLRESEAGPKPGLVDRFGPGVHTDMDISHFRLSATALEPFFEAITLESAMFMAEMRPNSHSLADGSAGNLASLAEALRQLGCQAESAMLTATGGVNTHKGAIWTLGLLCAAVGSLAGYGYRNAAGIIPISETENRNTAAEFMPSVPGGLDAESCYKRAEAVCAQAARLAQTILAPRPGPCPITNPVNVSFPGVRTQPGMTNGLAARQAYGLRSARDEALEGFPSIQARALPLARSLRYSMLPEDGKVISVLLAVMCEADDTCLVARGGLPALQGAKSSARQVLDSGGPCSKAGSILYRKMVADFKEAGLSPGGSADLCAATLFLAEMEAGITG